MNGDKMQTSRFELKYVISEETARRIRDFTRSFLELDENCADKPAFAYPVHSLYLDSDQMMTYWDTINGTKNRFKLRIRYYNDDPAGSAFLEIKQRLNNCIKKQRAGVRREAIPSILAGRLPPASDLISPSPKNMAAAQNFCRLMQKVRARPKMHIAYLREAYVPVVENSARLTLDRSVRSEPDPTGRLSTEMSNPLLVWGKAVVLELKFTARYPNWFRDLVRTFDLRQCGAAKYADGVTLLGGHLPQHRHMPSPNPDLRWSPRILASGSRPHVLSHPSSARAGANALETTDPAQRAEHCVQQTERTL